MHKNSVFNLNPGSISANHKQYPKSHTFNTGTPDDPQLKAHTAQLVTVKLDILQNPGWTPSLS
jgi:hypothetical protein